MRFFIPSISSGSPLFVPLLKGTRGTLKYELGLFYFKIKVHLKILPVSTKQAITGQVIKILHKSLHKRVTLGGGIAKKSLEPIHVN